MPHVGKGETKDHPLSSQTVLSNSPQPMDSYTMQDHAPPMEGGGGWSDDEGGMCSYGGDVSPVLTAPRKVQFSDLRIWGKMYGERE